MKRRSFLKKIFGTTLAFLGLGGGTYYYAREIEPGMLTIREETIASSKIPEELQNFRVVQFSDTHIGFNYTLDQLTELIKKINKLKPDLVVFTGDLVDKPHLYNWNDQLIQILSGINAIKGKYWVYGNHDHGGYGTEIVQQTMEKSNFKLLQNSHVTIENQGAKFNLAGIDDMILGQPNIQQTLKGAKTEYFTLLLAHEPDFADISKNYVIDAQFSGHSHGGQVRIPFFGHIYTPTFAEEYVQGKFTLGSNPLQLFVNRGIGTTRLPYRFLCKPELTVYQFQKDDSA